MTKSKKTTSFETDCIHARISPDEKNKGVNTPVYPSSAYNYRDQGPNIYPRYFNTINHEVVAQKICMLEGAEKGLMFSSGMAAITTSLLSFLDNGDHIIFSGHLYGGTVNFINEEFSRREIEYTYVNSVRPEDFAEAVKTNTKAIYIETPSNPLLTILDVEEIAKIAKNYQLISLIDNTFASPVNQNPAKLGIDVVLHSGTKYLGGHSDLCFGVAVGKEALIDQIYRSAINYGGSLNALDYYLIERSLKTLSVRVGMQNKNAQQLADFLSEHTAIGKVYYPGLEDHPNHQIAAKQMTGFGGMLSFELEVDNFENVDAFLNNLRLIRPALSLGGVETTICSSALTSHSKLGPEKRAEMGISDMLLRLSVGIENVKDLISDIENALMAIDKTALKHVSY